MNLPTHITLVEVSPRDGLQNEARPIALEDKLRFIRLLEDAGLKEIEATSFVRPDAIPQLADGAELMAQLMAAPKAHYSVLVPNMKGLEKALAAGVREVAVFVATSDAFSLRNINADVETSYTRIAPVVKGARDAGLKVRGYLSTVFGCPYEGEIAPAKVQAGVERLLALGCYEVSLGDTTGIANPVQVKEVLGLLLKNVEPCQLAGHFHDTYGMAIANIMACLEMGLSRFDASAGGLGGCPYARGASGNVATEDVLWLCQSLGIHTGVDVTKVIAASRFLLAKLGRESLSKTHRALVL